MELADRVVLVTGASRGIGLATARLLADHGALVVGVARDEQRLDTEMQHIGGTAVAADLARPEAAQAVVDAALTARGRLDAVVVNAGVGYAGPFDTMPPDRVVELVDLNLRGSMLLTRAAIPAIGGTGELDGASRRGAMVFVGSIAGAVGVPQESVYSATKAALHLFSELLAEELRGGGISVSTVVPGVVDTDFLGERGTPYTRRFPRPLQAEQVAQAVLDVLESGRLQAIRPRWLGIPARLSGAAPGVYRRLARRFG